MNASPQTPHAQKPLRSWRWMLPLAAIPLLAFLVLGALGGRDAIQILTGIQPFGAFEMLLGAGYLASYFALTFFSPMLVLAAALVFLRDQWSRQRTARSSTPETSS